jgi:uncharacterized membrane protein
MAGEAAGLAVPMLAMLACGACNTILMKLISRQVLPPAPGEEPHNFHYPFFQTLIMMIGMFFCLLVYAVQNPGMATQTSFPKWVLSVPAVFDLAGTTFIHASYAAIAASTVQMIRGSLVLFTCVLSELFLAKRHERHQYLGVALVTVGLLTVASHSVLHGQTQSTFAIPSWVGVALALSGELCLALKIVLEEKYFSSYTMAPLQMVGYEGMWGIGMLVFVLAALQSLAIEKTSEAWYMMRSSAWVAVPVICAALSIATFNWAGAFITKRASAVARSTIDVSRTVIIWVVELLLMWNVFSMMQCIGFIFLTCGTLVYNRVIHVPGFTQRDDTKSLV